MIERFRCDLWNAIRSRWYTEARSAGDIFTVAGLQYNYLAVEMIMIKLEQRAVACAIG